MSNRDPQLCAKAVQDFWNHERELIKQGQGTRNWTQQEQIEIMNFKPSGGERKNAAAPTYGQGELGEKGMNYDKYEGQHMKSAAADENKIYQGDYRNIQALTRDEHFAAHGEDFRNATNGYYNPETGEMSDFGNAPPRNIQPQHLSEPYVESTEYQYIKNSMDTQYEQSDMDNQIKQSTQNAHEQTQNAPEQAQSLSAESTTNDALATYEQKQAEMKNPTQDNAQDTFDKFEQAKSEMQTPQPDSFQEALDSYDQKKADMQNVQAPAESESAGLDAAGAGLESGGESAGLDSGGGMDTGGSGMEM